MTALTHVVCWLNVLANSLGQALTPIAWLPGWLSATLVAAATGLGMLVLFKYTSNQRAIRRARQEIRANLLAVKLFHESLAVGFRAQGRVLLAALRLLLLAVVPMLVMVVPVCLLLGQLALWYQVRPLRVGEEAVVTLKLRDPSAPQWPNVELVPTEAVKDTTGPVRVFSQGEVCWNVRAGAPGLHRLRFLVAGEMVEKELAVGDGFMRVSTRRPGWDWSEALLHPAEEPFGPESAVAAIEVDYPKRASWTSGSDSWLVYWLAVSLAAGFCCRGLLKVNL